MPRPLKRIPLELGLSLNINQLLRGGFIESGRITQLRNYHWLDADRAVKASAQIAADMTKGSMVAYQDGYGEIRIVAEWIDQEVQLVARLRHFGGRQWYFVCPRQGQLVSVLWSPPGERFFAGRKSWGSNVAYLSQYYGHGARAHYNRIKLCDRIGAPGASEKWEVPPKPKWMRWRTYNRLADRYKKYCDKAETLPKEYRLDGDVV